MSDLSTIRDDIDALMDTVQSAMADMQEVETELDRLRASVEDAMPEGGDKGDWQYEVANGDTVLGYADWVAHQRERDAALALATTECHQASRWYSPILKRCEHPDHDKA